MHIPRNNALKQLDIYFDIFPIVAILGPRQCGKTTLSEQFTEKKKNLDIKCHHFDLEDDFDLAKLNNPRLAFEDLEGLIIIDEIQRRPDLFPILRVLADRKNKNTKFLILGSASQDLIQQSSETLAGRIGYIELTPFTSNNTYELDTLWHRGGFPRSFLAKSNEASYIWRDEYIKTFLERDIPNLGIRIPAKSLKRFWQMLAHFHGHIFNASKLANSMQISSPTAKSYLDILTGTFMIRQLQPWFYNTKKRLVKNPKIYFRDSGILHNLLNIKSKDDILKHPSLGASWEGFALEQYISEHNLKTDECFFWALHSGAELDLVHEQDGKLIGVEIKYTDHPSTSKSMRSALQELQLDHLYVLHPGKEDFKLDSQITAKSLSLDY